MNCRSHILLQISAMSFFRFEDNKKILLCVKEISKDHNLLKKSCLNESLKELISSHMSYHLLPKEISQEDNCAMIYSFTFLLSQLQKSIHNEVPIPIAYVANLNLLFAITTTSWLHIYFPFLSFILLESFSMSIW